MKHTTQSRSTMQESWDDTSAFWKVAGVLGISALIAGGLTVILALAAFAMFIAPLVFWFAWNVLDFGESVGLSDLGFWAILLATFFLLVGWFGKVVVAGIVMVVNPDWFQSEATMQWPDPSFKNFVALALLAGLAAFPHKQGKKKDSNKSTVRRGERIIDLDVD